MSESGPVALGIFILHLSTLSILLLDCFWFAVEDGFQIFSDNIHYDMSTIPDKHAQQGKYSNIHTYIYIYIYCKQMEIRQLL